MRRTGRSMEYSLGVLVLVVVMATSAHLLLRAGMTQVGRIGADEVRDPVHVITSMLKNPLILGAAPLYAAGFVGWTVALSRLPLTVAYPALAMTYVLIPLASWAVLQESVTAMHWGGMAIVVVGVLIVLRAGTS